MVTSTTSKVKPLHLVHQIVVLIFFSEWARSTSIMSEYHFDKRVYFLVYRRYASAACEVSLPQTSSPACKLTRNAALVKNKKIFTLKHDPALHGFALLNMTQQQLAAYVLADPFTRYFATAYLQITQASSKSFDLYNNLTAGQEITDFSEYLKLSAFFQSAPELAVGVNIYTVFFLKTT